MGLFSGIKKAVGGIFKGVGKIFKPVTKLIHKGLSKIVGKKWARRLMLGAAVFTAGTALIAGAQMFSATAGGFWAKFVAGGKEFLAALAHPIKGAKSILPGGGSLTGAGGVLTAPAAATGAPTPGGVLTEPMQSPQGMLGGPPAIDVPAGVPEITAPSLNAVPGVPAAASMTPTPGMLSRAAGVAGSVAKGAGKFIMSPGGGMLVGNVLAGMGESGQMSAYLKAKNQYNVPLTPEQMAQMGQSGVAVPQGFLTRGQRLANYMTDRPYGSAPVPVGTPEYVAGLARGGR